MIRNHLLATALLWALGAIALGADTRYSALDIINRDGRLTLSDGSSSYTFRKGGVFASAPLGISGRSIDGKWRAAATDPDKVIEFTITGRWGWVNGPSAARDYRTMSLWVYPVYRLNKHAGTPYQTYFFIDELRKR